MLVNCDLDRGPNLIVPAELCSFVSHQRMPSTQLRIALHPKPCILSSTTNTHTIMHTQPQIGRRSNAQRSQTNPRLCSPASASAVSHLSVRESCHDKFLLAPSHFSVPLVPPLVPSREPSSTA